MKGMEYYSRADGMLNKDTGAVWYESNVVIGAEKRMLDKGAIHKCWGKEHLERLPKKATEDYVQVRVTHPVSSPPLNSDVTARPVGSDLHRPLLSRVLHPRPPAPLPSESRMLSMSQV